MQALTQAHGIVSLFALALVGASVLIIGSAPFTFIEMQSFWKRG